jgi:hypothetical protein
MSWDELLKAAPPIVQAMSILVTAIFAVKSLHAWRTQLVGKRRFEAAEEVIMAVYRVKDALEFVRSPASTSDEAADRPRSADENPSDARMRDTYFVPLKRLRDAAEDFVQLQKVRVLSKVHFGEEAVNHIKMLFQARAEVIVAAQMLSQMVERPHERVMQPDFYQQCERKIWAIENEDDVLTKNINRTIEEIERICTPYLK